MAIRHLKFSLCALTLVVSCALGVKFIQAQEDKPLYRGVLYRNWSKLGLTDEQTNSIYKIQGEHRAKIKALADQIKELQKKERLAAIGVLTKAQIDRLKEVGTFQFRELLKERDGKKEIPKDAPKPKDKP